MDEKLAWEKPCGGGADAQGLQPVPVSDRELHAQADGHGDRAGGAQAGEVTLKLGDPLVIYSRFD
jgi:hypothetical protein